MKSYTINMTLFKSMPCGNQSCLVSKSICKMFKVFIYFFLNIFIIFKLPVEYISICDILLISLDPGMF